MFLLITRSAVIDSRQSERITEAWQCNTISFEKLDYVDCRLNERIILQCWPFLSQSDWFKSIFDTCA